MKSLPEWTDLRFFLELARSGTLSGASRRLEVEHTTVARRIDRLEQQLGATLFDRSREGYELTEMGQAVLPHAESMEAAVLAAVSGVKTTRLGPLLLDGDHSAICWRVEFTGKDGKVRSMEEVAWQTWRGEELVEERFFYDPQQMAR